MEMSNHQPDIFAQEKDKQPKSENAFHMDSDLDSLFAAQDSAMHMSTDSSSSSHDSLNDWSQLSASSFWPTEPQVQSKDFAFNGDLNSMGMGMEMLNPDMTMDFLQQMDMDFNPSMAIDPTALHFSYPTSQNYGVFANDIDTGGDAFPFTFSSHPSPSLASVSSGDDSVSKERRLSVGSSSSAASPSPAMEHARAVIPNGATSAADALAERVRHSAGVLLAVPSGSSNNSAQALQPKIPISRMPTNPPLALAKPKLAPFPYTTTAPNTAPSSTTSSPSPAPEEVRPTGRTKTSHTTIERRYRTNLNARIQSLRQAVPALRVLEDKPKKGSVKKDSSVSSAAAPSSVDEGNGDSADVVDERGFIDGVKVARKCSKANVLGKAVEYIRVLKKREARLTREQDGLKTLIKGLVGGPALLREWEEEWRAAFGGKEKDEIEGEEAEPMEDDDIDEEGDGDDDDDEGRARKKVKIIKAVPKSSAVVKKAPAPAPTEATGVVPEKRKRGRPRKVLAASALESPYAPVAPHPAPESQPLASMSAQPGQAQPQQYLLATFALFSFFNSPLTTSPSPSSHTHSGSVLSATPAYVQEGYGWRELVQVFHLAVSALVFFSIIVPWLPRALKHTPLLSLFSLSHSHGISLTSSAKAIKSTPVDRTTLLDALVHTRRGASDEIEALHGALGVPRGVLGLVTGFHRPSTSTSFERRGLEQRAWVRLGELVALRPGRATPAARLQAYLAMRAHVSWFKASTADLATMALVIRPLSKSKAEMLWGRAGKTEFVRPFERLVVSSLTVDEAAEKIASLKIGGGKLAPVALLAGVIIRERLRSEIATLFVKNVIPSRDENDGWVYAGEDSSKQDEHRAETINAGKSLGGRTRELAEAVEKVWASPAAMELGDVLSQGEPECDEVEREVCSLLTALVLYRRLFPSSILSACTGTVAVILSPPPSPPRKDAQLHLALRRVLASDAFDRRSPGDQDEGEDEGLDAALEDARDRVVDMLVECERVGRARAHKLK